MTANHILLHRLADIMLVKEQNFLPVDLLFDDEQIGDFTKSIQIDSPYQQMLLEGVLTESVKDEKLFVSFTVEGYFHYVLGEVIYNRTVGHGSEALKQIVEDNNLNGIKEGVVQCLIRDIYKDDLTRLEWLIDQDDCFRGMGNLAIATAFLIQIKNSKKEQDYINDNVNIDKLILTFLENSTENKIKALEESLNILKKLENIKELNYLYERIIDFLEPDNLVKASFYLVCLNYIPKNKLKIKLKGLKSIKFKKENSETYLLFLERLGRIYLNNSVSNFRGAISVFKKSLQISLENYPNSHRVIAITYNKLGLAFMYNKELAESYEMHLNALKVQKDFLNGECSDISTSYECLGILELKKDRFNEALNYFHKTLEIKERIFGNYHSEVSSTLAVMAFLYSKIGDVEKSTRYFQRQVAIESKVKNIS